MSEESKGVFSSISKEKKSEDQETVVSHFSTLSENTMKKLF